MTTQSMAQPNVLPSGWIDRLFQRFSVAYGKHWSDMWADVPIADVKDAWACALAGLTGEQIAAGLKACGKFPPTLPEFVALCKPAPVAAMHRPLLALPRPAYREIPPNIRAEIDKLLDPQRKRDPKDWARQILRDHEAGTYKLLIGVEMACEALGEVAA